MSYYAIDQQNGSVLIDPAGHSTFSIGLNHIEYYPYFYDERGTAVWLERFGNSRRCWLSDQVKPDLLRWGFNAIGWTPDNCEGNSEIIYRHTPNWSYEAYQWANMPYCHMIPFIESHQWDAEHILPDIRSDAFAEWCDYAARSEILRLRDDTKLIGYFYTDCPTWIHPGRHTALFEGELDPQGKAKLFELASHYYRLLHDTIRRYDPHHLIFGDRLLVSDGTMPDVLLRAAAPWVDAICIQISMPADRMVAAIRHIHQITNKPVLIGDTYIHNHKPLPFDELGDLVARERIRTTFVQQCAALAAEPACLGYHLCGGYLRNTRRHRLWQQQGLRLRDNSEFTPITEIIAAGNQHALDVFTARTRSIQTSQR